MRAEKILRRLAEKIGAALREVEDRTAWEVGRPRGDPLLAAGLRGRAAAYRRYLRAVEDAIQENREV
ncbi:hypothetical protein [Desulfovirgula thermocuniculi]|uniref:hypothetical protein n=1 Tax=Desulfovirgula thermocuniculi TaxID=348842 RepID=UPI0003F98A7A|nr:hypothetical protein [Desulfovirgula thermocuniculi]